MPFPSGTEVTGEVIVETGDKAQILNNPKEEYTLSLLESVKALI